MLSARIIIEPKEDHAKADKNLFKQSFAIMTLSIVFIMQKSSVQPLTICLSYAFYIN